MLIFQYFTMNRNILAAGSLILSILFLSLTHSFAQPVIRFDVKRASDADHQIYSKQFASYTLGILPVKATSDLLRSDTEFDQLIIEVNGKTFDFNLRARDIRPAHYKLRVQDDTGIHEMPRSLNKTYAGRTNTGHYDVRITADDNFFYALIEQGHDAYYIEPARKLNPAAPADQFLMYWGSDNLKGFTNDLCGVKTKPAEHSHAEDELPEQPQMEERMVVCKVLEIALANDFEMYQEKGSVAEVEAHNLAVINNVETNYDDEFTTDVQFDIVEIFVAASNAADPWTNSTNPNTLLDAFTAWGPNGFENVHDIGALWTNREFDGDVIGLAWIQVVCTSNRYHTVQDFTNNAPLLRCLQAHELGHNFNAGHDAAGSTHIMAPSVQNTNTWSAGSESAISAYIPTRACMTACNSGAPPVADFSANDVNGCASMTVQFTDESANNPTSWSWSFPGGSPSSSTLANPIVIYNNAGLYDVTLTVTNAQGSNSITQDEFITVGDDPIADFDFTIDELEVAFENLSEGATSFNWNFDDGNNSTLENPIHNYEEDGVYDVVLTVTNSCGSDNATFELEIITIPVADFDASPTEGCDPMEVEFFNYSSSNALTYLWNFPGGSPPTSTAFEPNVVYETPGNYPVTLTVYNDAGQDVFTINNFIHVNAQPNAIFSYDAEGLEATFSSAGSVANTYSWNFGDGTTSTLANPVHIYPDGGAYTVTLTVTTDCGTDVHQMVVLITSAPVAAFSSNVTSGCAPLVVQYINQSSGAVSSFSWVFQGGTPATSTISNPVVTYNNPGVYDVTLTVSNAAGSDVQANDNYITVNAPTQSNFTFVVNGMQVVFANQSNNSTGSTWHFGDGIVSDDEDPVHTYITGGTYTVMLISAGLCGNDTSTALITIQSLPVANFTLQQNGDCVPATVQFTNLSTPNVTAFKWTFEGGSPATSTLENPLVSYNSAGTFDVQLVVFAPAGSDTINLANAVEMGTTPESSFLISTNETTVSIENQSTNASTYLWMFGDGATSTEAHPTHQYASYGNYVITLIATNVCGDDTSELAIILGTIPNAAFSYNDQNGCAPFEVQFIDQTQNNPTSWLWTFEGGTPNTSTLQHPIITYQDPGVYSVSLQATNANGTDVVMLNELIQVANAPDATFTHTITGNIVALNFDGTEFDSLHWDFGDGTGDNSINPTIEYENSGDYQITLTVYNACGSATFSVPVHILETATNDPVANEHKWQIKPNPFADFFSIYGEPLTSGNATIRLYDLHGKVIHTEQWNYKSGSDNRVLQVGHLPSGIILVQIQDVKSIVILRGVKQ